MNRALFKLAIIVFSPLFVMAEDKIPDLLEMLAFYPGQDGVYINLYDSTGVSYQGGEYIYDRYYQSEAMVLRKGGGGIASAAGPIITKDDNIKITAFTLTPEGDTINIPDSEMTMLELFGKKRRYIVSFPDARAGAVLVFRWQLKSREPVFSGRRFLGRTYPVVNTRCVISAPTSWEFKFLVQPTCINHHDRSPEYLYNQELWINYIWETKSLPEPVFENNSPPANQLIPCLYYAFSYDKRWPDIEKNKISWPLIIDSYSKHLNGMSDSRDEVKDEVKYITKDISGKREKLAKIVEFVTANFRSLYSDIDIADTPWDLLARGYGSQAEAALLVGSFLNLVGVPFEYVLISTRDNDEVIESLPALFYFNRLLIAAHIDSDTVWVDPFYRGAPLGVLPFEDQQVKGLIIGGNYKGFITTPISDYRENDCSTRLKLEFDDKGKLVVDGVELLSGAINIEEKYTLQNLTVKERNERWSQKTTGGIPGASLQNLVFDDANSNINPYKVSYQIAADNYITPETQRLYIPLDILGRWRFENNYDNRQLPIELGRPFSQQDRIVIDIPPGFKAEHLPENYTLNSYLGEIISIVSVSGNTITVIRGLSVKPYRLSASESESLSGFYHTAADQAGKFIVLRK